MQEKSKRNKMFTLIEEWKESCKTQKQFSSEHGIKYSTFLYWMKKYRQSSTNSQNNGFLPLEVVKSGDSDRADYSDQPKVEVEFSSGITLRIY
jgi:transposase-like protein